MPSKQKIREAVLKNRGGLSEADDQQIMIIWRSLDAETQQKYLDSIKAKESKNAVSTRSGIDI